MTQEEPEEKKHRSSKIPVEVIEEEYVDCLEATPGIHHRIGIMFAWESGLRVSEIINLQPEDIDIERRRVRINGGKGDKDRVVPLPKNWMDLHLKYIPLACSKRALQKAFEIATEKCGLKAKKPSVHFHSLRHGFATHQLRIGMPLQQIQMALGHSDLSTTSVYLRVSPDEMLNKYEELNVI